MKFRSTLLVLISLSFATLPANANSNSNASKLKGSYGFTGSHSCLVAPGQVSSPTGANPTPGVALPNSGFNAQLQPNDSTTPGVQSNSFTTNTAVIGIRTFYGNGTGTVKGTAVSVVGRPTPGPAPTFPRFPPSASGSEFSFKFTYTVDRDGGWTAQMVPGSYTSTFTSGPRTGQTATVDAIPPIAGMTSNENKTLIAAHTAPTVETHTYSNGDVWPQICNRSRVFIELNDDDRGGRDRNDRGGYWD